MISFDVGLFAARSSVTDWAGVFQFEFRGLGREADARRQCLMHVARELEAGGTTGSY